jgi:hypothetical protein
MYKLRCCKFKYLSNTRRQNDKNNDLINFFFNLRIVGGGVQTGSTRHRDHLLSYCACPGWLWGWRIIRWNKDRQGKPKYSEKTCPSASLSITNPTWPDPGLNPGHRGGKPTTNRFSYGAAKKQWLTSDSTIFVFLTHYFDMSSVCTSENKQIAIHLLPFALVNLWIYYSFCSICSATYAYNIRSQWTICRILGSSVVFCNFRVFKCSYGGGGGEQLEDAVLG